MPPRPGGGPGSHGYAKPRDLLVTLKRLLQYLMKVKWMAAVSLLLVLLSSSAQVAANYMLKPIINEGIIPLIGTSPTGQALMPLIRLLITLSAIYLMAASSTYLYNRLMVNVSGRILLEVRRELFNKLEDLPIRFFDTHSRGELMSRFTNDVDTLREALGQGAVQLISSTITVTGTLIMMLVLSPVLTLIVLAMLLLILLTIRILSKRSRTFFLARQKALGTANGYMEEMITGQKLVKVFCHEEETKAHFSGLNEALRVASTSANTFANSLMPFVGNMAYINYAAVAATGAWMVISGWLDIGTIGSFLQYSRSFFHPVTAISQEFSSLLSAMAGAERIFEIIDMAPEVDDGNVTLVHAIERDGVLVESSGRTGGWAWRQPNPDGTATLTPLRGRVEIDDVTFSYEPGQPVLKNVSFYAKAGQKIALVGSTGAGKTTITNLLNRFYDLPDGKIRYDGININDIKKDDLRRSLAMVLQDTRLFTGTVWENIRYGRLDATDEEVVSAAKLANAHYFIEHLPQGYDTILSEDSANLSQGQRQLLAIARAAVADAPVLVLDEATSSIDTRTEALIERGMDQLMMGRTVFVIAHRLSTVRKANAILVLEHGEIIERGDHDDLLAQQGKYYQLYTGQFELS